MKQIIFNLNNEPYYSEDFIKGFKCGVQRQFEADKADRPQGEWIIEQDERGYTYGKCTVCGTKQYAGRTNFCPDCGANMRKEADNE